MNNNSNIIEINEEDFNEKVIEASQDKLIIVDFWAPWCGPCKQLTPLLEKIVKTSTDKVTLVKINIDDNQQVAAQLRIQSIPAVYAFKEKQVVNAFQGLISEKQIIEFIEKCLGSELNEDTNKFYEEIEKIISEKRFEDAKDSLLNFISNNSNEKKAIHLYLDCLIELKQLEEFDMFTESLEDDIKKSEEIKQLIKKVEIIKNNLSGPKIDVLLEKLNKNPDNINLIIEISDKYFATQEYEKGMGLLLMHYPKNKEIVKNKMIEFFNVLGSSNEHTIYFRKKLSQIMFS